MRRFAPWLLAVLVLCAAAPPAVAEGLYLWRIEGEQAVVNMTGSIHVGREDFFPLAAPIEEAFAAADALAVEVDPYSPENLQLLGTIMMKEAVLPGDETLQSRLGEELWTRLSAYAEERGVPLAAYSKLKPGLVAMVLVLEEYKRAGFDPELGIDKHFLDLAREQAKPIRELETIQQQFDLFLQVDDALDDVLMDEMLDQMEELTEITRRMIELWQAGDAEGLDRLMQEQIGDEPEMVAFYRKLLDERNAAMADSLDAWLHGDEDVFVVVGGAHFGGEHGLVKLLAGKGWNVEQVGR